MPHQLKDCACCHADNQHVAFPNAVGGGHFVLCSACVDENWEPYKDAFADAVKQTKAKLAEDPKNEGYLLTLELLESSLALFQSKNGQEFDEAKLNDAYRRLTEVNEIIVALAKLGPKGNA